MAEEKKGADKAPAAPAAKKGIEVIALHKGFYQNRRKAEGDEFVIESFEHLGSWMKCKDKEMQAKHEAAMLAKKQAAKAKAGA